MALFTPHGRTQPGNQGNASVASLSVIETSVPSIVEEKGCKTARFCTLLSQAELFSHDQRAVTRVSLLIHIFYEQNLILR